MNPQVEAAIIAGCVGILTLIATVIAQIVGFRSTRANTERQINAQREQLDTTLKAQSEQLDTTLAEQRTRTLNERFATAADRLGSDKQPAIRLAGVYAMAGLADDWQENRQACVDVLCAYLRIPYEPYPGDGATPTERLVFKGDREVRHTVIRVIGDRLRPDGKRAPGTASWRGRNLDFTEVVFDGGDFSDAEFTGNVSFIGAEFTDETVYFNRAKFIGGRVSFDGATFSGGGVDFREAQFGEEHTSDATSHADPRAADGRVDLRASIYVGDRFAAGPVSFVHTQFTSGGADFRGAHFVSGTVDFSEARFGDFTADFEGAHFDGGIVSFNEAEFRGEAVDFENAHFTAGRVDFDKALFLNDGTVYFTGAEFAGAMVSFQHAKFDGRAKITFQKAEFSGGTVDYSNARFTGASINFSGASFNGTLILFARTETYGNGIVNFSQARLSAGCLDFSEARFYTGTVDFSEAQFGGGTVDFSEVWDWSSPPLLPERSEPLPGLLLPAGYYPAGYSRTEAEPGV
jgi:uncharacterized protein YjbI with pentapeptide repeats